MDDMDDLLDSAESEVLAAKASALSEDRVHCRMKQGENSSWDARKPLTLSGNVPSQQITDEPVSYKRKEFAGDQNGSASESHIIDNYPTEVEDCKMNVRIEDLPGVDCSSEAQTVKRLPENDSTINEVSSEMEQPTVIEAVRPVITKSEDDYLNALEYLEEHESECVDAVAAVEEHGSENVQSILADHGENAIDTEKDLIAHSCPTEERTRMRAEDTSEEENTHMENVSELECTNTNNDIVSEDQMSVSTPEVPRIESEDDLDVQTAPERDIMDQEVVEDYIESAELDVSTAPEGKSDVAENILSSEVDKLSIPAGDKVLEAAGDKASEAADYKASEAADDMASESADDRVFELAEDKASEAADDNVTELAANDKVLEPMVVKVLESMVRKVSEQSIQEADAIGEDAIDTSKVVEKKTAELPVEKKMASQPERLADVANIRPESTTVRVAWDDVTSLRTESPIHQDTVESVRNFFESEEVQKACDTSNVEETLEYVDDDILPCIGETNGKEEVNCQTEEASQGNFVFSGNEVVGTSYVMDNSKEHECVNTKIHDEQNSPTMEIMDEVDSGLQEAIEVAEPASSPRHDEEEVDVDDNHENDSAEEVEELPSIAIVHDLSAEDEDTRQRVLTESEKQLGKQRPYWIPDEDATSCMICAAHFSILNRRHHCRACGRVLCSGCCKEKAMLEYMKNEAKKQGMGRICAPCHSMLARIEEFDRQQMERSDEAGPASSSAAPRGVLKTRAAAVNGEDQEATVETSTNSVDGEHRKSVVFRDGTKPGTSSNVEGEDNLERSTAVKPKKKQRKRAAVSRRVVELRVVDELASALPTSQRPLALVSCPDGTMDTVDEDGEWIHKRLEEGLPVIIYIKRNLIAHVQICKVSDHYVWCVASRGFAGIGMDEIFLSWRRTEDEGYSVPYGALRRISLIFEACTETGGAGVRRVCERLPSLHSDTSAIAPITTHILFFRPTVQDVCGLPIPSSPFVVGCFIHNEELPWVMACPNRLLVRLGIKYAWYPTPLVNVPNRDPVMSGDTTQTVLKVFTDFRGWTFRMKNVFGCTITLVKNETFVKIPITSYPELRSVLDWNSSMLSWGSALCVEADSHLVCDDSQGFYVTQVLSKNGSRKVTGASFIIIDGGLKTAGNVQISVVEDGVAIRLQPDRLEAVREALKQKKDISVPDPTGSAVHIEWVDHDHNACEFSPRSAVDGVVLDNVYQYGLSLERALSTVLPVSVAPDYGIRLSHVYNMDGPRLSPDMEPKLFSVAEMLFRETAHRIEPFFAFLINMDIHMVSLRVSVNESGCEYEIAPWGVGMEQEMDRFKQSMDGLVPVLYGVQPYMSDGFRLEIVLSFVSIKPLPIEM